MSDEQPWRAEWEVLGELPESGQGVAYIVKSRDGTIAKAVLKELKNHTCSKARKKARERMLSEVNNLATVHARGAKVPKYISGNVNAQNLEADCRFYFVMEFIAGNTLNKLIQARGSLPTDQALAIALDLCQSIKAAGSVIHRDIKPENIMIRDESKPDVVLLDYGISFNMEDVTNLTGKTETLGNKFLNLPELRIEDSEKRDKRSDLTFACGILFYCLTGKGPRVLLDHGGLPPHLRDEQILAEKLGAKWPDFKTFFSQAFRNSIDERFQKIDDLIARLEFLGATDSKRTPPDVIAALTQASESLRQFDPKIRAKECEKRLPSFRLIFSDPLKRYLGYPIKISLFREPYIVMGWQLPNNVIRLFRTRVHVEEHPEVGMNFFLRFVLDGSTCVVYADFFESGFILSDHMTEQPAYWLNKEVYRYPMEDKPDTDRLCAIFQECLVEIIGKLHERLLNKS